MASILVLSPLASHPQSGGAKQRIFALTRWLRDRGHRIHFVYTGHERVEFERTVELMRTDWETVDYIPAASAPYQKSCGKDYGVDDWYEPGSGERVAELARRYEIDVALVNYVFQSKYFEFLGEHVLKVLDVHDRLARRELFEEIGSEPGFFYTTVEEEMRGLARADIVLAIQDNEVVYFEGSGRPVVVVGHSAEKRFVDRRYGALATLGYMGATNKFNLYSLEKSLPPLLAALERLPGAPKLHIAGNIVSSLDVDHPQLVRRGYVANAATFYAELDLVLNPTLVGTGLKIKTVEALAYGVPLVSTKVGFDGLKVEHPFHDCAGVEEMVTAVETIAKNPFSELTRLSNVGKVVLSEYLLNLDGNLATIFSEEVLAAKRAGADLRPALSGAVMLGSRAEAMRTLWTVVPPGRRPYRIAHLVNPVAVPKTSDLYIAQPVTFATMRIAKAYAAAEVEVDLLATAYEEDGGTIPPDFTPTPPLETSILDRGTFELPRKLPLLSELFARFAAAPDADVFIYTNVDIALMPHFYSRVAALLDDGHDAIVINRRTIAKRHTSVTELTAMFADSGKPHPGYDCFVFTRTLLERFVLDDTAVGVHMIGRVLVWNMMAFARNFRLIEDEHLTFHIGDDVASKDIRQLDYVVHNTRSALRVFAALDRETKLGDRLVAKRRLGLLSMDFGAGGFSPRGGGRALDRPVFIHALFRAGSTYLWQTLRGNQRVVAYYEPLHEDLALFKPDNLDWHRSRHSPSRFKHADKGEEWFFKEFEPLIDGKGVKHFNRRFSYDRFADNGPSPDLKRYVDALIQTARPKNTVLEFNRTTFRQAFFRREYPDGFHVYMMRNARDQWMSYCSFRRPDGHMGFLRNNLMIAGKCREAPLMAPLGSLVPLARSEDVTKMHQIYDEVYFEYSLEEHYVIFYYLWLVSLIEGCRNADLVLDMNRLSRDRPYQLEVAFEFARRDAVASFVDASIRIYAEDEMNLPAATLERLEAVVAATVVKSFPDAAEVLAGRGCEALAARLASVDATVLAPYDPDDLAQRAALMDERLADALQGKPLPPREGRRELSPLELDVTITPGKPDPRIALMSGFSFREGTHVWANGTELVFAVRLPAGMTAGVLDLTCVYTVEVAAEERWASIEVNGVGVADAVPVPVEESLLQVPLAGSADGRYEVRLSLGGARQPTDRENRALSLRLLTMTLRQPAALAPAEAQKAVEGAA